MPDRKMKHHEVRGIVWGTEFEVLRVTAESFLPEMAFKDAVDMIVFFNAIFNAHFARMPINQERLKDTLGMSRNAVRARLEVLEARGVIESGWQRGVNPIRIRKAVLDSPESDERLQRIVQLHIDAIVALSKLEGDYGRMVSDALLRSFSTDVLEQEIARRIDRAA
jgi:hypothetical protein